MLLPEFAKNQEHDPVLFKKKKSLFRKPDDTVQAILDGAEEFGYGWDKYKTQWQNQNVLELDLECPQHLDVLDRIDQWCMKWNDNAFGLDLTIFQHARLTQYKGAQKQRHDWHTDYCSKQYAKLAYVCLLQVPEEGGDLWVAHEQVTLEAGDLAVFPAFLPHRVTPVTKGTRTVVTGWYSGPPLR